MIPIIKRHGGKYSIPDFPAPVGPNDSDLALTKRQRGFWKCDVSPIEASGSLLGDQSYNSHPQNGISRDAAMTMRTTEHFKCSNGHEGIKKTIENDQTYSAGWSSVDVDGMHETGKDSRGWETYKCAVCGKPMEPQKK